MAKKLVNGLPFSGEDLTGRIFTRWKVIKLVSVLPTKWLCVCSCPNKSESLIVTQGLTSGMSKSCGCLRRELSIQRSTKHGHANRGKRDGFYYSWISMRQRCNNPRLACWKNYGGRGIKVCARWNFFLNFYADMRDGWSKGMTLERKNTNGNYTPDNCRWIEKKYQPQNMRNNVFMTLNGVRKQLFKWAAELGINAHILHSRLWWGWSDKRALTTPVAKSSRSRIGVVKRQA